MNKSVDLHHRTHERVMILIISPQTQISYSLYECQKKSVCFLNLGWLSRRGVGRTKLAVPTFLTDLETSFGETLRAGGGVVDVRPAEGLMFSEPLPLHGSLSTSVR